MEERVKKIISKATNRFAEKEGVSPSEISIIIHTKDDDYRPKYWYMVGNSIKKDAKGNNLDLNFTKDILNKIFDPVIPSMFAGFMVNKFRFFEEVYSEQNVNGKALYFVLKPTSETAEDFKVYLMHNAKLLKQLTIEEIVQL